MKGAKRGEKIEFRNDTENTPKAERIWKEGVVVEIEGNVVTVGRGGEKYEVNAMNERRTNKKNEPKKGEQKQINHDDAATTRSEHVNFAKEKAPVTQKKKKKTISY